LACLVPASKPAKNGETPYVQTSFRVRRFNGLAIIQGGLRNDLVRLVSLSGHLAVLLHGQNHTSGWTRSMGEDQSTKPV
ncbi:hypothetical protein VQ042_25330, partial [Aurantimonas sp. A2-1-M11]|uniref:hypothetical protein n=1 Tax=Aurantimonas sp. A2-1-M11 TaxID=3113712 RepID=UPI002F932CE1